MKLFRKVGGMLKAVGKALIPQGPQSDGFDHGFIELDGRLERLQKSLDANQKAIVEIHEIMIKINNVRFDSIHEEPVFQYDSIEEALANR
jgi:hypothetical protein